MTRRAVVVGGGIGGSSVARELLRGGVEVVVIERGEHLGGLVTSFEVAGTPLEMFYHHVFPHESEIVGLIGELGLGDRLGWYRSSVAILTGRRVWPFTGPLDLLRFGPLPMADRLRMGVGSLRVTRERDWRALDAITARDWLASRTSDRAASVVWEPLLRARFGPAGGDVPAAWMWGRFRQRAGARRRGGERLGYLRGGFRQMFDALERRLSEEGADLRLGTAVESIRIEGGRVRGVDLADGTVEADVVVFAGTLPGLGRLVPAGSADPRWTAAEGLGAICVILELPAALGPAYWTNVCDPALPFGGVIEHTNLVPPSDYGGRHVVYLSRYFAREEGFATADLETEADAWLGGLEDRFPGFRRSGVLGVHPFRTPYAAPLPRVGHLSRIPPIRSHVPGLFLCTTAQIYPADRGMDEGIRLAKRVARIAEAEPALRV
ncbi:MAG: FAD-dependent oxidoreductase [Actinomycetota bacterium]